MNYKLTTPISILIGSFMIAGTILYTNGFNFSIVTEAKADSHFVDESDVRSIVEEYDHLTSSDVRSIVEEYDHLTSSDVGSIVDGCSVYVDGDYGSISC